jgi:hypothetical protein
LSVEVTIMSKQMTLEAAKAELAAMIEADGGRHFVAIAIQNGHAAGTRQVSAEDIAAADMYLRSTHATRMRQETLATSVARAEQAAGESSFRARQSRNGIGR